MFNVHDISRVDSILFLKWLIVIIPIDIFSLISEFVPLEGAKHENILILNLWGKGNCKVDPVLN
jgi:hypothetical protein